ncbi:MAG: PAS domain S-box protein, partial [Leptospiraceae bacterium]|nr:PAS domain S-box protein [Leptospiraceae bacterium]
MLKPGKPDNEKERLRDLYSYDILDSPSEESFNRITRLARKYLNIPISLISLIDENRQWFKSKDGLSVSQTERDISFCAHAILEDSTFVVKDASKDERFYDNPLVSSGVKIRFYAGTQLKTPEGYNIGTLCVIDYKSRNLTFDEKSVLEDLGKIVINELELRKKYIAEKKTSVDILRRKIFYKSILDSTNDSIVVMNENGIIQEVNESTKKIFMYSREELIGQNVNILMPEPYKSEHDGYISDYLNTGFKKVIGKFRELKAIKKNGEVFPCELSVNEVKIEEESFFTGVLRDLTELNLSRKKQERQLEGMKVLNQIASVQDLGFEQLLQIVSDYLKLPIGMISNIENSLYTIEYCISFIPSFAPERKSYSLEDTYCNFCIKERNVFAIENIHNSEYISFPCYEIFRFESYIGIPIFLNEAIIGTVSFASIKPFSRKFDEADEEFFRMLSKLLSSIMIQHNMNEKLRRSEERLKRGQNFANIGTWDWNIQTGELYWTEKIAPLFGYPEGELETSYENFLRALHPEDREKVVKAIDACIYSDVDYYIEHRVLWPNGKIRWLLEKGDVLRNEEGEPVQMLGVVQDITHIKEAEQALLKSKEEANQA